MNGAWMWAFANADVVDFIAMMALIVGGLLISQALNVKIEQVEPERREPDSGYVPWQELPYNRLYRAVRASFPRLTAWQIDAIVNRRLQEAEHQGH